jgi:hypothetical protein
MTPEKIENPIAKVDFEDARMLADLASIVQDLSATMQTCSRLKELFKKNSKDHLLIESLWTAALIRYARCFTKSKRFGLSESIFHGLKGDPTGAHQFYINLRNKHVAHSVNPFEQIEVGAILAPAESKAKEVIGVATFAMRHISADFEGINQLGMLSKIVLEKVCELARQCEQRVLDQIKRMPINSLYVRARLHLTAPGPEAVEKPRKQ